MSQLQEVLRDRMPKYREQVRGLVRAHGDHVISQVTVAQAYGGMRGVKAMACDTSVVEADKGLIVRGRPLMEIKHLWPEEVFYLLLTGDTPDEEAKADLQREFDRRAEVPSYVWDLLRAMPRDSHPMCMLDTAILVMERESKFRQAYHDGMQKDDYWIPMLDDAMDILARLPVVAAGIYQICYRSGNIPAWTQGLDMGANYAQMLSLNDPNGSLAKFMRLYLNFHADHEGGNVSANTCHTVGSALSDAYYSVSAGLNGLAGPLHGLANQQCLEWILETMKKFGGVPTEEQLREDAFKTLRSGQVIPGYGHAVLRVVDPRFQGFIEFGREHLSDDPVFQTVERVFRVVPKVLEEYSAERVKAGKNPIANVWPNVDAGSGALLYYYGMTEFPYYTVVFSVSRAMGMLAQLVLNRGLGIAITRPKSVSTAWIQQSVKS